MVLLSCITCSNYALKKAPWTVQQKHMPPHRVATPPTPVHTRLHNTRTTPCMQRGSTLSNAAADAAQSDKAATRVGFLGLGIMGTLMARAALPSFYLHAHHRLATSSRLATTLRCGTAHRSAALACKNKGPPSRSPPKTSPHHATLCLACWPIPMLHWMWQRVPRYVV